MARNPKVFCSHGSIDKPLVQATAEQLAQAGIDPWLDAWEIRPGDNIVTKINQGLAACDAALIFCSKQAMASSWVQNELDTLLRQAIEQQKPLIPVMIDQDAPLPPMVQTLLHLDITNVEGIINAIYGRSGKPRVAPPRGQPRERHFRITLQTMGPSRLGVQAGLDGETLGEVQESPLGADFHFSYQAFLAAASEAKSGVPTEEAPMRHEQHLIRLGQSIGKAVFPPPIAGALTELLDHQPGDHLRLTFETAEPQLLSMPFEAARLPDNRVPALQPGVRVLRQYTQQPGPAPQLLAGPLRILVAVGAPDEGATRSAVLDREHELQTILDAVDRARQYGQYRRAEVTILEVAHPSEIQRALLHQPYHVLHISGHGRSNAIEMEDEDGGAVLMTPTDLVQAMQHSGRAVPLVFLSACLSGNDDEDTASFAQSLLAQGVPLVLAMQGRVSDWYATQLAGSFYDHLNHMPVPLASRALALARQEVEQARRRALERGEHLPVYQAEYATPSLFCAGDEQPLLDHDPPPLPSLSKALPRPPMLAQMPRLSLGDLIGRRGIMRRVLRVLQDDPRLLPQVGRKAGALISGIGGAGKSALAGRIMVRLSEEGWTALAVVGRWGLGELALKIGGQLLDHPTADLHTLGQRLLQEDLPDEVRLQKVQELIANHRVLLVLDNFEDNLTLGGHSFLDETTADVLTALFEAAGRGKLVLTSRYPIPAGQIWLAHESMGPLSAAETRKLFYRLPSLAGEAPETLSLVLRHIGGHPRMLEYLDALLRGGEARLPEVAKRLSAQAQQQGLDPQALNTDIDIAIRNTLLLGAEDILLDQLIDMIRATPGDLEALFQASVFVLPVDISGLAFAVADGQEPDETQIAAMAVRVRRIVDTSLLTPLSDGLYWVHRWTAQSLRTRMEDETFRACCQRAGEYRMWRVQNISGSLTEAVEAVRRFLQAEAFDRAAEVAQSILVFMEQYGQLADVASFAAEVRASLPQEHVHYPAFCSDEADALVNLGRIGRALELHQEAHDLLKNRARSEPERADYQRDLSVSHNKMGDLLRALGQGDIAQHHYEAALAIRQRLAEAEPDRADYQ